MSSSIGAIWYILRGSRRRREEEERWEKEKRETELLKNRFEGLTPKRRLALDKMIAELKKDEW